MSYVGGIQHRANNIQLVSINDSNVFVLDFEGLNGTVQEGVQTFYSGGAGSNGSMKARVNYGVTFDGFAAALKDATGSDGVGNFKGEPTIRNVVFTVYQAMSLNVPSGFKNGFSFYYATLTSTITTFAVYSELNGTGTLLGGGTLLALDPSNIDGLLTTWSTIGCNFTGIAKSVVFDNMLNEAVLDNLTFGSSTPLPGNTVLLPV